MGGEYIPYMMVRRKGATVRYTVTDQELEVAAKKLAEEKGLDDPIEDVKERVKASLARVEQAWDEALRDAAVVTGNQYEYLISGEISWGDVGETSEAMDDIYLSGLEGILGFETEIP